MYLFICDGLFFFPQKGWFGSRLLDISSSRDAVLGKVGLFTWFATLLLSKSFNQPVMPNGTFPKSGGFITHLVSGPSQTVVKEGRIA